MNALFLEAQLVMNPDARKELGLEHDPRTIELYRHIETVDFENGDYLELDKGILDTGERLKYILDSFFEQKDSLKNKLLFK